jgi:hypothetical protein
MAQTATTKQRQAAIERYDRYSLLKQRVIWLYYKGAQTNNTEGISPTGIVGGVTDYAISGNIKYYYCPKQFRHQAKVSNNGVLIVFFDPFFSSTHFVFLMFLL